MGTYTESDATYRRLERARYIVQCGEHLLVLECNRIAPIGDWNIICGPIFTDTYLEQRIRDEQDWLSYRTGVARLPGRITPVGED